MIRKILLVLMTVISISASARQPQRGYRGFVDWASSVHSTKPVGEFNLDTETGFFTGFSTSHGYQFNERWFLGAGYSWEKCGKLSHRLNPIFLEGRADLKFGKFSPFADLRIGYDLMEHDFYMSPTIGYRINWGSRIGVNIGVGASMQRVSTNEVITTLRPDETENDFMLGPEKHKLWGYFTFRVGIDF